MAAVTSFIVTPRHAVEIRRIIIREPVALNRWGQVKDSFVQHADRKVVEDLLHEGRYARAILQTLFLWDQPNEDPTFDTLVEKLRTFGLNALANELLRNVDFIRNPDDPEFLTRRIVEHVQPDFFVTLQSTDQICALILKDPVALQKWNVIGDDLVMDFVAQIDMAGMNPADKVRASLEHWVQVGAAGATFNKLLTVFVGHGLNRLKRDLVGISGALRERERPVEPRPAPAAPVPMQIEGAPVCPICLDNRPDSVLLCGHCLCGDCLNKILLGPPNDQRCPTCRDDIQSYNDIRNIYL